MSKTKRTLTDPEARRYFSRMLQMNPLHDPAGVLAVRRRALGLKAAVDDGPLVSAAPTGQLRAAALEELDRLRREFWTLPLQPLQSALEGIDVKRLPDLVPLVTRLRTVAACRSAFPQLASTPGIHLPLFHAFKTAVVLPPGEAGPHKEKFIRSIKDKEQLKRTRQTVQKIRQEYPVLFQLESDWFETLSKIKKPRAKSVSREEPEYVFESETNWGALSPGIIVAIVILLRILLAALR